MEITQDHVEWAIVDRLQKMLERTSNNEDEYDVTHAFALFSAICGWVRCRLGYYLSSDEWPDGLGDLRDSIASQTWGLPAGKISATLSTCSAWEFLVWVRNTMCHADQRNVIPIHEPVGSSGKRVLAGFRFGDSKCYGELSSNDMRRLGAKFAQDFCRAVSKGSDFDSDAKAGVFEATKPA